MDIKTLLQADYLDIVFDRRNKSYGGYELRRHYNRRLGKAVGFLFVGVGIVISFSFISAKEVPVRIVCKDPYVITDVEAVKPEMPKVPVQKLPTTPPPPPPPQVRTLRNTEPVVEPDKLVKDNDLLAKNTDMDKAVSGPANADGDSVDAGIMPAKVTTVTTGTGLAEVKANTPFHLVQQMPRFDGDMNAYIGSHLQYPDVARANGIEGRVVIEFVINEDGAVSNAKVVRSIGGGCDEVALKMVNSMPHWKPGKQNGTAVKVFFTLPVKFELQ